jgi:hypothetical protein
VLAIRDQVATLGIIISGRKVFLPSLDIIPHTRSVLTCFDWQMGTDWFTSSFIFWPRDILKTSQGINPW